MFYAKNEVLFNEINLDPQTVSRLIYLATYVEYNDKEENLLIRKITNNKSVAMKRKDIKLVMGLGDDVFRRFMNELLEKDMMFNVDGKFYLNSQYFTKGTVKTAEDEVRLCKDYTRIFIDTVRQLYNGCPTTRRHGQLGYVFQLIPFLNREENVLVDENNKPLGLTEICKILKVKVDGNSKNENKLETALLKFTVEVANKKHYLFKRVMVKGYNHTKDFFIINPYVIWSGNNLESRKKSIIRLYFREEIENK